MKSGLCEGEDFQGGYYPSGARKHMTGAATQGSVISYYSKDPAWKSQVRPSSSCIITTPLPHQHSSGFFKKALRPDHPWAMHIYVCKTAPRIDKVCTFIKPNWHRNALFKCNYVYGFSPYSGYYHFQFIKKEPGSLLTILGGSLTMCTPVQVPPTVKPPSLMKFTIIMLQPALW